MAVGAVAGSGVGRMPVLVAVGDFAVGAKSQVVVEPGGVDLGVAQGGAECPGDLPGVGGRHGAAVGAGSGEAVAQDVPLAGGWVAGRTGRVQGLATGPIRRAAGRGARARCGRPGCRMRRMAG